MMRSDPMQNLRFIFLTCASITAAGCSLIVAPDAGLIGDGGSDEGGAGGDGGQGGVQEGGFGGEGGIGGLGGQGGEGGIGGQGGEGGTGGAPECDGPRDCEPPDSECAEAACDDGTCGFSPLAQGTVTTSQTVGDCQELQCDGASGIESVTDNDDVPVDSAECTSDVCTDGVPSNPPLSAGTPCGVDLTCDGAGGCLGCSTAEQCPGVDDECKTRTCTLGVCSFDFAPDGTELTTQADGDCQSAVCDGAGNMASIEDDDDLPDDALDCTDDVCTAGVPSNPPVTEGETCDDDGGSVCNDAGLCVGCNAAIDCGLTTDCLVFECTNETCGSTATNPGTPTSTQTAGDCREDQCDGAGGVSDVIDDADLPVDGVECTLDVCTAGASSNPPATAGTACGTDGVCDGAGACAECITPSDCPGMDTECSTRTCVTGSCGVDLDPLGSVLTTQTPGDCQRAICDGSGAVTTENDDSDLPVDTDECTDSVCSSGQPSLPFSPAGTPCNQNNDVCDGNGVCVECLDGADCASGTCTNNVCDPLP